MSSQLNHTPNLPQITLAQKLYRLFSDGRTPQRKDLNAARIFSMVEDLFSVWCNFNVDKSLSNAGEAAYEQARTSSERSSRHQQIITKYPDCVSIKSLDTKEYFLETLKAMEKGVSAIEDPVFWDLKNRLYGSGHLIVRSDGEPSVFGPYHYKLVQYKNTADLKEHSLIQGCLVNRLLEKIQDCKTEDIIFVLKDKTIAVDRTRGLEKTLATINLWHKIRYNKFKPETKRPPKAANHPWREYANIHAKETNSLVMIPMISKWLRDALRAKGFNTTGDIAVAPDPKIFVDIADDYYTGKLIYMSAMAYKLNSPIIKEKGLFPLPKKDRNLYFDFESADIPGENAPHVYLIGVWDKEENKYVSFVAKGQDDEERIFKEFIEYTQNMNSVVLYHWGEYEVRQLKKLKAKYPHLSEGLDKIIAGCIDLSKIIERSFYLPAPGISLKSIAPLAGFAWRQDDCNAMESMMFYGGWLEGDEEAIKKVLLYNEDDCIAMLKAQEYVETTPAAEINFPAYEEFKAEPEAEPEDDA